MHQPAEASQIRLTTVPKYLFIANELREKIKSGKLTPGRQLPSEEELARRYGVSRMTVRQSLALLSAEGLVSRQQGAGTYVNVPRYRREMTGLAGIFDDLKRAGVRPSSRVMEFQKMPAPGAVCLAMQIPENTEVYKIRRLRLGDGVPVAMQTLWLVAEHCPGIENEDITEQSLYGILVDRYGCELSHATHTIEATIADHETAPLLDVAPGAPILLVRRLTYMPDDRPLEWAETVFRGDMVSYTLTVDRDRRDRPPARE